MNMENDDSRSPLRLSMVGYLNTVPMVYGLKNSGSEYDLRLEVPAQCFDSFQTNVVDVALIPVGVLPLVPEAKIVTDYCIGCEAAVRTVCLFSRAPLENVQTIYLDTDSRTSVLLVRVLAEHFWHLNTKFVSKDVLLMRASDMEEGEAVLMIGDKVFEVEDEFEYKYDLGQEWYDFTGLPFVFAVWVARPSATTVQLETLSRDLGEGIAQTDVSLAEHRAADEAFDLESYFANHISYQLDDRKRDALDVFLKLVEGLPNPSF